MTHDELLAKLDDYGFGVPPLNALRAVVELHEPVVVLTDVSVCSHCESNGLNDPDAQFVLIPAQLSKPLRRS